MDSFNRIFGLHDSANPARPQPRDGGRPAGFAPVMMFDTILA
jgi:hypothetical protein